MMTATAASDTFVPLQQQNIQLEGRGRPTKASFNVVAVKAYFVHEAESKRQLTVRCVVVTVMIF